MIEEAPTFAQVVARNASASCVDPGGVGGGSGNNSFCKGNHRNALVTTLTDAKGSVTTTTTTAALNGGGSTCFFTTVRLPGGESYADAVKSQTVKLDGVPVNPVKAIGCAESVTNSTMQEQESVLSSWADDDQCFLDSIRIPQEEGDRRAREPLPGREGSNTGGGGGFRRGRGQRGWRIIGGSEGNRRRKGQGNNNNNLNANFR